MYIYHALINVLSAHTININLNTIFYTHVEIVLLKGLLMLMAEELDSCQKKLLFSGRGGGGVNKTCDQYVKIIPDQEVCLERSLNGFAISLCSCFSVVIILCLRIPESDLLPYMHAMNVGPLFFFYILFWQPPNFAFAIRFSCDVRV